LGLPIARRLARAMGGDVWYVSRFPTGASFLFSMQLSRIIPDAVLSGGPIGTQSTGLRPPLPPATSVEPAAAEPSEPSPSS
jgi:hypothetical protein